MFLIAHIGHTHNHCEHVKWWTANSCGYTSFVDRAGRYNQEEARSICESKSQCIAVPVDIVESITMGTPYYRRSNGCLELLYDVSGQSVVPNTRESWSFLMENAMPKLVKSDRPTPIGRSWSV